MRHVQKIVTHQELFQSKNSAFFRSKQRKMLTMEHLPIAATVDDPFSFVVHQTSPISNPNAAHATCKYAWIRSGSMVAETSLRQMRENDCWCFSEDLGLGCVDWVVWE